MIRRFAAGQTPSIRRPTAALVERLESRRLLSTGTPFDESFIFGPANSPGAAGYLPDHGALFGDRGNGLNYGWNVDEAHNARLRHSAAIPDEYDTSITFTPGQFWQVAVPDGQYHVSIALGDLRTTSGLHEVDVQGTPESFVSTRKHWWDLCAVDVTVSDGFLTVSAPLGVRHLKNDEIDSLTISQDAPGGSASGLAAPANLTTVGQTQTSVQLQWAAPAQGTVTGYDIYRGQNLVCTVGPTTTTCTDTGLTSGTSYTYTVTALDSAGQSLPSNSVTAATQQTPQPPDLSAPPGNWHLAFDDEFNSLNTNVWTNGDYWWDGNGGSQSAFEPQNASVSNGILSLTAMRQPTAEKDGEVKPYTSGLLQSGGIQGITSPGFGFTYGYIETRAMFAPGNSMSSTMWMLPVSHQDNFELDLWQNFGKSPNILTGADHDWPDTGGAFSYRSAENLSKTWHTYGVDWEPNQITWYIDGKQIASYDNASVIPQQAMYLIMNLTAGGNFAGNVNSHTAAESSWQIDYVRVWQH